MKTLALVAKRGTAEAAVLARHIQEAFPDRVITAERHLAEVLGWPVTGTDQEAVAKADLVVVLGGDGTLIRAARLLDGRPTPILGVNLGSLGFMTEIPKTDLTHVLRDVLEGRAQTQRRMKLTCRLWRGREAVAEEEVLNDVVLNRGIVARLSTHAVSIDDEYVTTYHADGVVIATPTGSTAYALSAGGPIVHPDSDAVVIAPICSHALTQRPIVVPSHKTVHVRLGPEAADVHLTLDGQGGHVLRPGDRIEVQKSSGAVTLIRNPKLGYFDVLRQRLHWGER